MFCGCKNNTKDIYAILNNNNPQLDRATGVTIIYSKRGNVEARLFANEFIRNETAKPPYIDMNKGIRVEFYNDSTKLTSTLTAEYARYYEQQGNILIRKNVVIINKKGDVLKTQELVWNQKINKFFTEKAVEIITPQQTLYGDGMEANRDFSLYDIKNLHGKMAVPKSQMPE